MRKFTIITLGKYKEHYWKQAEDEYLKRLKPYAKTDIIELKEIRFSEKDPVPKIRQVEADLIKRHIPKDVTTIALHEAGTPHDSLGFAQFLSSHTTRGEHLTFILGGPLGFDRAFLSSCDHTLSLSPLTMPHNLARVMFIEQLYRAETILAGKRYETVAKLPKR